MDDQQNNNKGFDGIGDMRSFIIGLVLLGVGVFLVLQNTRVNTSWFVWSVGGFGFPTGVVVVPLLVGIGLMFYKPKSWVGRIVLIIGLVFLIVTILLSVHISFMNTSLFNYILMFASIAAGLGLLLKGLFTKKAG